MKIRNIFVSSTFDFRFKHSKEVIFFLRDLKQLEARACIVKRRTSYESNLNENEQKLCCYRSIAFGSTDVKLDA